MDPLDPAVDSFVLGDARILTMDADFSIPRGDLVVRDGRITEVGVSPDDSPDDLPRLDLDGKPVLPGFVQAHIHLCQTLLRNQADDMALMDWLSERVWPYEAALEPDDLHTSARLGLAELALSGTTCLLDMGTVRHTDAVGEAVEASGMRATIGKCMMDRPEETPDALLEDSDASLRESLRLLDRWHGVDDGRIRYAFAPRFAVSCTDHLLRDVVEAARDRDVQIHTHASETTFENDFTREHHGCRNIEYLDRIGMCDDRSVFAHGVHVTDRECERLAETGTTVCHCPSSNLKLASGIADMPRYDEYGVQVALGADGAPCNNNLDAFTEMRLAALIHKPDRGPEAMPARRILKLATIDGARALGRADEVGSIEPGKLADLVVVDLADDPATAPSADLPSRLVYSAQRSHVAHVFAGGETLVEDGDLVDTDVPALLEEADAARRRVVDRM